jgi:prophage regulatory protein
MSQRVIRLSELASTPAKAATPTKKAKPAKIGILPVSPATIWRWVREDKFPQPFKLGASITVWNASEIEAFIANRAEGTSK